MRSKDEMRSRNDGGSENQKEEKPIGSPGRRDPSGIELGRWIGAPPEDQSPNADFRRKVADLTREVLASYAPGARQPPDGQPPGGQPPHDEPPGREPGDRGTPGSERPSSRDPIPPSPHQFDIRATAPYQLARAHRTLARGLIAGRRGAALAGDLVLMEVARSGSTSPVRLGRRLGIPASTLTAVINASVRRGLVHRRRHPNDGRRWLIEATPAGLEGAADAADAWRAADEALMGALSPIERDQLRWLLKRAGSALARSGP